jgi:hypothetical protein
MAGRYHVDLESITRNFPKGVPVPPLLGDFARFAGQCEHGSLGWFDSIGGEPMNENVVGDHDATLLVRERVGLFLSLPDGSQLALWHHEGAPAAAPAVVLVESEGQHRTLAPTLEAFLLAWGQGKTGVSDLDDAEAGESRAALRDWLASRSIGTPKAKGPKLPSFSAWLKAMLKEAKTARDKAAKAKAPKARRMKPALGTPTAESVADLVPRALLMLERLVTDPELNALLAELGFDVLGISKPDVLRNLVLPDFGVQFEISWPWGGASQRLEAAYPPAVRPDLERDKARMLKAIEVLPTGYKSWNNGVGGYVTFKGYPGKLPRGILLSDDRDALTKKLGPPSRTNDTALYWEDAAANRRLLASFSEGDELPENTIERLVWIVT